MRVHILVVFVLSVFLVFSQSSSGQQESAQRATDSSGRTILSTYDSNGQLVSTTDGAGNTKHFGGAEASAPTSIEKVRIQSAQPAATGVTIHVPADQPTIQAAINAANNGDTVLVSDGTYKENINFNGKAITVTSVNGSSKTTIDGGAVDSVVTLKTNEASTSVLNGFTITNGFSNFNKPNFGSGGGIYINGASPKILNNVITANKGCDGDGIYVQGVASPLIQGNVITANIQSACSGGNGGGGIGLLGGSGTQILNNVIANNTNFSFGGGISMNGAGSPLIQDNVITGNNGGNWGGGIAMVNDSNALIIQNLITGNTASQGGGIYPLVPSGAPGPTIVNNTVGGNSGVNGGSAIYLDGFFGQTQIFNNIFAGLAGQIAVFCNNQRSNLLPIFKFNNAFAPQGTAYGICTGETGQNGNISADPLLVDTQVDNFHLQPTSPAVDAGTNTTPVPLPPTDLDGNPRVFHTTVDIGAFEYQGTTTTTFSSTSLTFAAQFVGTASAAQGVTITNTGSTALQIIPFSLTGDFSESDTCHTSHGIPAAQNCTINISFVPTALGTRAGQLSVTSNDAASPTNINLSGTGITPVTLTPSPLAFGNQLTGTASAPRTLTVTNHGNTSVTLASSSSVVIGGTNSGDFTPAAGTTCVNNLVLAAAPGPGNSCVINLIFTPSATGGRSATVTVTDNAVGSPQSDALQGTGIVSPVGLSGTMINFGIQRVGTSSRAQNVTLTNNGISSLTITGFTFIGTNSGDFSETDTCPISPTALGAGLNCTISVTFKPAAPGKRTASLQITDSAPDSPQSVLLTGIGRGASGDFDGDGKADVAIWRPSDLTWFVVPSSNPTTFTARKWGNTGDIMVPGDYDGDGITDIAAWRPSNGTWYVIPSSNPTTFTSQQWGLQGDIPVPGDYDGDGITDFAVWRPSTGTWYIIPSSHPSSPITRQWGNPGDIPVPGDYDGDGKTDFAIWRPSTGTWWILPSGNPGTPIQKQWGLSTDVPVPGDYDGDGKTDFAIWRPSTGTWWVIPSSTPGTPIQKQWGLKGDIPVPRDYDGDRTTDFAVWRPSNGTWYIIPSSTPNSPIIKQWGLSTDVPVQKPVGQ